MIKYILNAGHYTNVLAYCKNVKRAKDENFAVIQ